MHYNRVRWWVRMMTSLIHSMLIVYSSIQNSSFTMQKQRNTEVIDKFEKESERSRSSWESGELRDFHYSLKISEFVASQLISSNLLAIVMIRSDHHWGSIISQNLEIQHLEVSSIIVDEDDRSAHYPWTRNLTLISRSVLIVALVVALSEQ